LPKFVDTEPVLLKLFVNIKALEVNFNNMRYINLHFTYFTYLLTLLSFLLNGNRFLRHWNVDTVADVDECATGSAGCRADASCSNFAGGFTCTCNDGYAGDGSTCDGKSVSTLDL